MYGRLRNSPAPRPSSSTGLSGNQLWNVGVWNSFPHRAVKQGKYPGVAGNGFQLNAEFGGYPFSTCRSNGKLRALVDTITFACLVVAAYARPLRVDRALHRVPVQCRTPAIVKSAHYPSAPPVLDGQCNRNVLVFAHQHDFQPATAGFAIGA